jgi:iodotyrosine deiodinase
VPARRARLRLLEFERLPQGEQLARSRAFFESLRTRRTVRQFSRDPVPRELVENAIATAGTAPSGAHQQPWTFVVVSDPDLKRRMRDAAEKEERRNYDGRMSDEWLRAIEPLGTDWRKPHIEDAPYVIVVFEQVYGLAGERKVKHYYAKESVGIAVGFLLAALHQAGLATLTHTPSPMGFLARLLERPRNERAYLLIPVGYPAPDAEVPDIERKPLDAILVRR